MTDLSEALLACEEQLALLDEADALGVLGLLMCRAINRRPPGQRMTAARTWADELLHGVERSMPQ